MAYHFSANQFEDKYNPRKLGNWEYPKWYPERPRQRFKSTKFIADDNGCLLEGIKKENPWGTYVGTWDFPKRITREYVNKLVAPPERLLKAWGIKKEEPEPVVEKQSETDVEKSESEVEKSETEVEKSETEVEKSETSVRKSETSVRKSDTSVRKSDTSVRKSDTSVRKSDTSVRRSDTGVRKSDTGVRKSESVARKSETGVRKSETGARKSEPEVEKSEKEAEPVVESEAPRRGSGTRAGTEEKVEICTMCGKPLAECTCERDSITKSCNSAEEVIYHKTLRCPKCNQDMCFCGDTCPCPP